VCGSVAWSTPHATGQEHQHADPAGVDCPNFIEVFTAPELRQGPARAEVDVAMLSIAVVVPDVTDSLAKGE